MQKQHIRSLHFTQAGAEPYLAVCREAHHALAAAHLDGLVLRLPLVGDAAGGNQLVTLQCAEENCDGNALASSLTH